MPAAKLVLVCLFQLCLVGCTVQHKPPAADGGKTAASDAGLDATPTSTPRLTRDAGPHTPRVLRDASQPPTDAAPLQMDASTAPNVKPPVTPPRTSAAVAAVKVSATDPAGNALQYEWRVTDGEILSTEGPLLRWQLPAGRGLHFAYVLVSNGKGAYVERRLALSTDDVGVEQSQNAAPPPSLVVHAPPTAAGVTVRAPLLNQLNYESDDGVYLPDFSVYLQEQTTHDRPAPSGTSIQTEPTRARTSTGCSCAPTYRTRQTAHAPATAARWISTTAETLGFRSKTGSISTATACASTGK